MRNGVVRFAALLLPALLAFQSTGCSRPAPKYLGSIEVIGDVERPGFYDIYEGEKAQTVVKQVGEADREKARFVFLYHLGADKPYKVMPLKEFLAQAGRIELEPEDTVVFSRVSEPEVYLCAENEAAGPLLWTPEMTLSDVFELTSVEGQHYLRMGIRISPYGEKDVGMAGRRAEKLSPGDTIVVYDLYQATVPKKNWIQRTPRKKSVIIDAEGRLKGAEDLHR